jgi:hypothetical protein
MIHVNAEKTICWIWFVYELVIHSVGVNNVRGERWLTRCWCRCWCPASLGASSQRSLDTRRPSVTPITVTPLADGRLDCSRWRMCMIAWRAVGVECSCCCKGVRTTGTHFYVSIVAAKAYHSATIGALCSLVVWLPSAQLTDFTH